MKKDSKKIDYPQIMLFDIQKDKYQRDLKSLPEAIKLFKSI